MNIAEDVFDLPAFRETYRSFAFQWGPAPHVKAIIDDEVLIILCPACRSITIRQARDIIQLIIKSGKT